MKNVIDSLLFMHEVRNSLCNYYNNNELSDFIMNEATDYQCLSLMIDKKLPLSKRNIFKEMELLNTLKHSILEDYDVLTKFFNKSAIDDILVKVECLEPKGISSCFNSFGQWNGINESNYWNLVSEMYKNKALNNPKEYVYSVYMENVCESCKNPKDNIKLFLSKRPKKNKKISPSAALAIASYSKKKTNKRKRTILKELQAKDLISSNKDIIKRHTRDGLKTGALTGSMLGSLTPGPIVGQIAGTATGATLGGGLGYLHGKKEGQKIAKQAMAVKIGAPVALAAAGYLAYKHFNNPEVINKKIAVYKVMINQQCPNSKDPQKCQTKYKEKISKLQQKLASLKQKA